MADDRLLTQDEVDEAYNNADQEIKAVGLSGGDVAGAQRAKRQAYLDNGGVILNPDALEDMYEALKASANCNPSIPIDIQIQVQKALAEAEAL